MKKLILICGLLASGFSFGANWVYVTESENGNVFYLDKDYYKYDNKSQSVDVWLRMDSKTGTSKELAEVLNIQPSEKMFIKAKNLTRYSCPDKTSKILASAIYTPNGVVQESSTQPIKSFSIIFPDSVDEKIWISACLSKGKGLSYPKHDPEFVDLRKLGYREK